MNPKTVEFVGDEQRTWTSSSTSELVTERMPYRAVSPGRRWVVDLCAVAGIAFAIVLALVRPWSRPLRVPFVYSGDALSFMSEVRNFDNHAWYFSTHRVGAPFGVSLLDLPMGGDNLYWALLRIGHSVTSDPALLVNLLFLFTFPLAAVVGFVLLPAHWCRTACLRRPRPSLCVRALHFLRNTSHLVLAGAVSVPVGCALSIRLIRGDSPFLTPRGRLGLRFGKVELLWALGLLLLATAGAYYRRPSRC